MRNRSRLLLLRAPWLVRLGRHANAQPNTNVPGGGQEQGDVRFGAGTQSDVTSGSRFGTGRRHTTPTAASTTPPRAAPSSASSPRASR